jgi:hypothetical protein
MEDLQIARVDGENVHRMKMSQWKPCHQIVPRTATHWQLRQRKPNPVQADPAESPPCRRSTRTKTKPRAYIPSNSGSRYSYAVTQLESEGVLNPGADMFMQRDFYQAEPDERSEGMGRQSLRSGRIRMKRLHFPNTFEPLHSKIY